MAPPGAQISIASVPLVTQGTGDCAGMKIAAMLMAGLMAGCAPFAPDEAATTDGDAASAASAPPGDALAPGVFHFAGEALWDGRPSLGGVWVAHPGVEEPSRVLIRRTDAGPEEAGAEITGALFRREDATSGPPLQVSSDAAEALGLVAGQPAALEVTALRRLVAEPDAEPGTDAGAPLEGRPEPSVEP